MGLKRLGWGCLGLSTCEDAAECDMRDRMPEPGYRGLLEISTFRWHFIRVYELSRDERILQPPGSRTGAEQAQQLQLMLKSDEPPDFASSTRL